MAAPAHTRLTWSGVFGTAAAPVEEWSFSLKANRQTYVGDDGVIASGGSLRDIEDMSTSGQAILAGSLATIWEATLAEMHRPFVVLTECRLEVVGDNGKVERRVGGGYNQAVAPTAKVGKASTSGPIYPLQTALCVSLNTAFPGRTGKGRFFLPQPALALDAGFRLPGGALESAASYIDSFLTAVRQTAGFQLVVASGGSVKENLDPDLHSVTTARVGAVLDTMRSRRGDLLEEYREIVF